MFSSIVLLSACAGESAATSIERGKVIYETRCTRCHSIELNGDGPAHRGVFGRPAGSAKGYDYTRALKNSPLTWTAPNLDKWLEDPEKAIPGTDMNYKVPSAADRAALIEYLKTQR